MATYGVTDWMVSSWLDDEEDLKETILEKENFEKPVKNKPSKRVTRQEEVGNRLRFLKDFLTSLPNVESHYCGANSKKLYL